MRNTVLSRAVTLLTIAAVAACSDGPSAPQDPGWKPSFEEEGGGGCGPEGCEEEAPGGNGPTPYQPVPGDTTRIWINNLSNNPVRLWTEFTYEDTYWDDNYWVNTRSHYLPPGSTLVSIVEERRISESNPNEYMRVKTDMYSFNWKCPFSACWQTVANNVVRQADNGVIVETGVGVSFKIYWQPKP